MPIQIDVKRPLTIDAYPQIMIRKMSSFFPERSRSSLTLEASPKGVAGVERIRNRARFRRLGPFTSRGAILLLVVVGPSVLFGQSLPLAFVSTADLPNAPGRGESSSGEQAGTSQLTEPHGTASIRGLVMDINGGLVPGAKVVLTQPGRSEDQTAFAANDGRFSFIDLPPGHFVLRITARGLETFVSSEISLRGGERYELPRIDLPIAENIADVTVVVTQTELAQEQVKAAEKQRAFGVFPNFYSSYIWDAAPLTSKQKFDLAFHSIRDPTTFVLVGVVSGIEQARNTFPGYGQGAAGYAKRFGAGYADDAIGRMVSSAILPSLFHQDPRYYYMGTGGKKKRAIHAIKSVFICKGDNGLWQPNYSSVLGSFASGGISNLYHSGGDRGVGLTFRNGFLDLAGHAANNLIREFVLRAITPNIPDYEQGKPVSEPKIAERIQP